MFFKLFSVLVFSTLYFTSAYSFCIPGVDGDCGYCATGSFSTNNCVSHEENRTREKCPKLTAQELDRVFKPLQAFQDDYQTPADISDEYISAVNKYVNTLHFYKRCIPYLSK